ncbi:hypothetical protein ABT096_29815 [Streptomyces sp. NPDC002561]|uniref:hypothetical protein n=1 Tax=Streptomyces sp. NPDC002561 TaxID=3154418 RepID=UPI00331C2EC3
MADVEAVIAPWLEARLGVFAAAETPADLEDALPMIRVERIGGSDDRFSLHPRIAVDVFAATADGARTLSEQIREALVFLNGPVGVAVVRSVRCDVGPTRQPWGNEAIHRRGATYTVSLRSA